LSDVEVLSAGSPFDPAEQEFIQFRFGDSIMATGSFDRRDFSLVDPLWFRMLKNSARRDSGYARAAWCSLGSHCREGQRTADRALQVLMWALD
jgi:hypothetical protein